MNIIMSFRQLTNICYFNSVCICNHPQKKPDRRGDLSCWDEKGCPIWKKCKKPNINARIKLSKTLQTIKAEIDWLDPMHDNMKTLERLVDKAIREEGEIK